MAFSLTETRFDKKDGLAGNARQVATDAGSAAYNVTIAAVAILAVAAGIGWLARKGLLPGIKRTGLAASGALTDDLGTRLG